MPTQDDFPDRWSCQSPDKRVVVEVRVPNFEDTDAVTAADQELVEAAEPQNYEWIEIPTTSVEQWVEKGEAAQIQRTAKVRFPTEWGTNDSTVKHNSPRRLIEQFDPTDSQPFMMARVWWQDRSGEWILQHFGWVGGVGQSGSSNVSKFWIYDLAELLSGVPIGSTFNNPTIRQVMEQLAKITNNNTPIPVSNALLMAPDTEEEFKQVAANYARPYDGQDFSAVGEREGNLNSIRGSRGVAYYSLSEDDFVAIDGTQEGEIISLPKGADENFDSLVIDTGGNRLLGDIGDALPGTNFGNKSFISNHDTLLDMYRWFEEKTAAKLHFEPQPEAVSLVGDVVPSRRTFAHDAVIRKKQELEAVEQAAYEFHQAVSLIRNDALYEMKPVNTLRLRGSTTRGLLDETQEFLDTVAESGAFGPGGVLAGALFEPPAEKYPVVKVQVPGLVEAAEGVELSPRVIESDTSQLANAEREATRELASILEETSEGQIVLNGTPRMMPFDRLDAFEVCDDDVEYEQEEVSYEIEKVKHVKEAGGIYKTIVKVSVWANDDNIEVVESKMVEA